MLNSSNLYSINAVRYEICDIIDEIVFIGRETSKFIKSTEICILSYFNIVITENVAHKISGPYHQ
jgi:hypothetical protein